ncbi:bacteriohemerythrin [Thalassotalea piscium]
MSLIEWDDVDLKVGIESIDNQHKVIIGCINELSDCLQQNVPDEIAEKLFDRLIGYTHYHFANEESYFNCLAKKDAQLHVLQHKHFIEQLTFYRKQLKGGLSVEVLDSLLDWFISHIQSEDIKFSRSIKK